MVNCPKCGEDVPKPYKTWTIQPYKTEEQKSRRNAERTIGMFACSNCGKKFRRVIATTIPK